MKFEGRFKVSHYDKSGKLKDRYYVPNGIVNDGKISILNIMFGGSAQSTTWYIGLINGPSPTLAVGDTMASHPGWTENEEYSDGVRQEWDEAAASLDGSDVKMKTTTEAVFSIDQDMQSIAGLFITSNDVKGDTTGTLWSTALFSSVKNLDNGDTLKIEYEITVG